ncbi:hypothetical protein Q5752_004884 [Cryptotrichosporon argae]
MSHAPSPTSPVRLVLFDVFDTLCTPRLPIHEQYAEEARQAGLDVTPSAVRAAFKPAFREMSRVHPLYGKHSAPPLSPADWWSGLIRRCMLHAGTAEADVERVGDALVGSLLGRFESDVGYVDFPETLASLSTLRAMGTKTSAVSNADPRILRTLSALGIAQELTHAPTLSWDAELSKPDPRIFTAACAACGEKAGKGVLMVGDELEADYRGATAAGLEARLIRRPGSWSDGAERAATEALAGVHVVQSLADVVAEVRRRNARG